MIKRICDICQKEITPTEENSVYVYIDVGFSSQGPQKVQKQEEYCSACTNVIKDFINGLKQSSGGSSPETPDTSPPRGLRASSPKREAEVLRQK